ncbi:RidA family protein [bacterium]|nr:MAG: RidA family protein [bacterium]
MPDFPPAFNTPIVAAGSWLLVSGQLALQDGALIDGGVGPETECVIDNIERLLESMGARLQHVVKINAYLADLDDYAVMNETMARRFGAHRPARTTIGARLVRGARVEMEAWAYTGAE